MSGMLQPNDFYKDGVRRRQDEARAWARADALGRLSRSTRDRRQRADHHRLHHHTLRMHLRAIRMHLRAMASPMAVRHHH